MLRRGLALSASILALTALAAQADARPSGWYASLSGGVSVPESTVFRTGIGNLPADFDTGWAVMGAVGYRWDTNWRLEFELAFRQNDWEQKPAGFTGEQSQFTQMINVAYDFPLTDRLALSLGAGVGGSLVSLDADSPPAPAVSLDDDYVLAGQLMASLNYQVSDRLELFLDYRYLVTADPSHDFIFGGPQKATYDNTNHTVMIGLRYDLSPDEAPQVYVPPPAPPAPPPVAKQYIVFFGWNKSNLTAQAASTVAQAAATAKQIGAASILVVGHTDTSGGARYNQKLSERRANTVANELVRNGISPEQISAMGKGETELLIQTSDGMREPQNRRVEINL